MFYFLQFSTVISTAVTARYVTSQVARSNERYVKARVAI